MPQKAPKVALVCDWLTTVGGAERVLLSLHELFPDAPIYTSQYSERGIDWFKSADVRVGWLKIFPARLRRFLGPLRQLYFSHLDLSDYDLIISVTGAEAKSIKKGTAVHLCYCHVPTQYYWQFYDDYLKHPGFGPLDPLARLGLKLLVKPLRKADFRAASRPDEFITISSYAASQIKKHYKRESRVIFPPVNLEKFHTPVENSKIKSTKSQGQKTEQLRPYLNYSRQVTWKHLDILVKSCQAMKRPLTLIGDGPEHENLVKLSRELAGSGKNYITFLPTLPQDELKTHLATARAFLFPSCEPFGIAPVEALAAGVPVIAYKDGGALDYIKDGKNGLFFSRQTPNSLMGAIKKFEHLSFKKSNITHSVENFSDARFKREILEAVRENLAEAAKGSRSC